MLCIHFSSVIYLSVSIMCLEKIC